jgi:hypothetical protein
MSGRPLLDGAKVIQKDVDVVGHEKNVNCPEGQSRYPRIQRFAEMFSPTPLAVGKRTQSCCHEGVDHAIGEAG